MISVLKALLRLHELQYSTSTGMRPDRDRLQAEMDRCMSELPASLLERYQLLRQRYGARAITTLERNICRGCLISQPAGIRQIEPEIYVCEQCGRVMYDPAEVLDYEVTLG